MMERRPLVAIGQKATDRIRDNLQHDLGLTSEKQHQF